MLDLIEERRRPRAVVWFVAGLWACSGGGAFAPDGPDGPAGEDDASAAAGGAAGDGGRGGTGGASDARAGDGGTADAGLPPEVPRPLPASTRRLSRQELANTFQDVVGFVPDALAGVPLDPRDHTFDRVAQSQTISRLHVEAFAAVAEEVGRRLVAEARLADLAPGCRDVVLPPARPERTERVAPNALSAQPDWSICSVDPCDGDPIYFLYAETPSVTHSFDAPVGGRYRLRIDTATEGRGDLYVMVDQVAGQRWTYGPEERRSFEAELELPAGLHQVGFAWSFDVSEARRVEVDAFEVVGPLDPAGPEDLAARDACAAELSVRLAEAAWRRPTGEDERARLAALYAEGRADAGFAGGVGMLAEAILGSPHFLYHVEQGAPVPDRARVLALSDVENANRLAYFACERPPDVELRQAAADRLVHTADQIEAQARRLFAACAGDTVRRFYEQWLWLERLPDVAKDPELFPEYGDALRQSMLAESRRFLEELTWVRDGTLRELFSAGYSWVDPAVAAIYGVAAEGADVRRVELPETRAGLLTQPSVLAITSKFDETTPVYRGVYVLRQLLCFDPPPPPEGLDITPPAPDPDATTRERWAAHSAGDTCRGCHQLIDPVGFAMERFDPIGRFREEENGRPVDDTGGLLVAGHPDGSLRGGAALARAIAESDELPACFAKQWFRFGLGRLETSDDAPALDRLAAAAREGSVREALIALTATEAFRHRHLEEAP